MMGLSRKVFELLGISWRVHVHVHVQLSVVLPILIILTSGLINFTLTNPDPERSGSSRLHSKLSGIDDAEDEEDFHGQDHHHEVIVSPLSILGSSSIPTFHKSDRLRLVDTMTLSDHHHHLASHTSHGQGLCEPIKIGLCMELGYNETTMPNLVGHDAQVDADALLQTFTPLIQYGCSPHLKLFLCSSHAPMCTDKTPQPIGPCRSLCESVRRKCEPVLIEFGFKWPPPLDCSKFYPENNHQHMCIPGPMDASHGGGFGFRSPSTNNWDNNAFLPTVINNGMTVQSTMNSKGIRNPMKDSSKPIISRPIPVEPSLDTVHTHLSPILIGSENSRNDITQLTDTTTGHGQRLCTGPKKIWSKGSCWTKCTLIGNNEEDEEISRFFKIAEIKFVRNYTLSWAILTLLTSTIGLTLAFRSPKLSTAERPVMYIALCQIMFSIGTILGTSMSVSCFMDKVSGIELLAGQGIVPSPCALIFLLTYFFGMATNLWWVILCLSWMLSVNGSLWISVQRKERSLFHLVTWGTSSVLTSTALIYKKVDADELTGLCGVGFQDVEALRVYVMMPLVGMLALGLCSLLTGLISQFRPNWIPAICCFRSNKSLHSNNGGQSSTNPYHDSGARHNHAYSPVLVLPPPPFNLTSHHHHHHHHNCSDQDDCSPSFFTNNPVSSNGLQLQRRRVVEDGKAVWRRVAIFSVVHAFPVACQVGTIAYELVNKVSWDNGHGRPNLQILLLRLNMGLISGLTAGVWVLSTFSWKSSSSPSQKLCCCHSLFNFFKAKNGEQLKVVPSTSVGVSDRTASVTTTSPLIIPVPVNSLATSYVTLNGTTGVPHGGNQGHTHGHGRHFAGITPRYHQPALPPLPARNPEPCQLDGWRRTETIV